MLNFCLVSAARHMLTDNDSSTTCRSKFKAPSLKTNTKIERPSENMVFNGKTVWRFQPEKKNRNNILDLSEKKPNGKQRTPHVSIDHGPRKQ